MPHHRDITARINLADPEQVRDEVCALLCTQDTAVNKALIARSFAVFSALYAGTLPGYHRCETTYHDMRHALDVTLACARLLVGHERSHDRAHRFGAERLTLGLIVALFHDAGYIRRRQDRMRWHGAQYTLRHVGRGARFLSHFLAEEGYSAWSKRAVKLIHFTGYEIPLDRIRTNDALDRQLGNLIGTADLIAQMADRSYLEKCRDFLYAEFELGGLTRKQNADGSINVLYNSGADLLSKTPAFYAQSVRKRLDADFQQAYRYMEVLFNGNNPYLEGIDRNMTYLQQVLDDGRLAESLRRRADPILSPRQHAGAGP